MQYLPEFDKLNSQKWSWRKPASPDDNLPRKPAPTPDPLDDTPPVPPVQNVTIVVVARDGQVYTYEGPASGVKAWMRSLRKLGVELPRRPRQR